MITSQSTVPGALSLETASTLAAANSVPPVPTPMLIITAADAPIPTVQHGSELLHTEGQNLEPLSDLEPEPHAPIATPTAPMSELEQDTDVLALATPMALTDSAAITSGVADATAEDAPSTSTGIISREGAETVMDGDSGHL